MNLKSLMEREGPTLTRALAVSPAATDGAVNELSNCYGLNVPPLLEE